MTTICTEVADEPIFHAYSQKGENQLPKVVQGVIFRNGVEVTDTPTQNAA